MKTTFKYLASVALAVVLSFTINSVTYAQRGGGHGGGGGGGFHGGGGGGFHGGGGGGFHGNTGGGFHGQSAPQRSAPQVNNNVRVNSSFHAGVSVNSNYGYRGHGGVYGGYHGYSGARGGIYTGGARNFYGGYYNRFYAPRLGFRINVLPYGYYPFYYGDDQFYYDNGLFYQQYADGGDYTVVEPPMGATVPQLPQNAKSITIDGIQYYELDGVYYQPLANQDGSSAGYQIVGKDGQLNTNPNNGDNGNGNQNNNDAYPPNN